MPQGEFGGRCRIDNALNQLAPRPGLEPGTCGLTPISRRGVKTANESLVVLATIVSMVPRCIARLAPVSSLHWLRSESRQTPSGSSTMPTAHTPWWRATPEKHWYRAASKRLLTVRWLPTAWHQSRAGSRCRRPGFDKQGAQQQRPFSLLVHVQLIRWLAASALILAQAKQRFTSKGWFSLSM